MVAIPDKKEYLCERCGRTINHRGKCLPCNVYLKSEKKLMGYRESTSNDRKDEPAVQHVIKDRIYARTLATEYKYATFCLFGLFIMFIMFLLISPGVVSVFLLVLIVSSLLMLIASFKNYISWSNGASGEERVMRELKKLSKDFLVINDLKLSNHGGNIDHLVLSRNGVFIIETKNYGSAINCNGDYWEQENVGLFKIFQNRLDSPSKQVKESAVRLKEFLRQNINFSEKLWFDAVVVLSNKNAVIKELTNPTVAVLKLDGLVNYLKARQNANLTQSEVNTLINCFNKVQAGEDDDAKIFRNLFGGVKSQIKFSDYYRYIKIGLIFGLFWLLFDELFLYIFNEKFYYNSLDIISVFFTGGLVAFLLGKFFVDVMGIKTQSKIANLMLASLLGWLPFLLEFWIYVGFSNYLSTSVVYILARVVLLIPLVILFNLLKWKI